jgi:hypothetical protein
MVVNHFTKQNVTTNKEGEFFILAKPKEVLIIASPLIEGLEVVLNEHSFNQNPLIIKVDLKINQLEEVRIKNITTKSVGIITQNIKEYTPAERKLYAATGGFKNQFGLDTKISFDRILDVFSGRTAMLVKELQVEKYETNFMKLKKIVHEEFYLKTLQFEENEVKGFLVYVSENSEIELLLKNKNNALLKLKLVELAFKFKALKNER